MNKSHNTDSSDDDIELQNENEQNIDEISSDKNASYPPCKGIVASTKKICNFTGGKPRKYQDYCNKHERHGLKYLIINVEKKFCCANILRDCENPRMETNATKKCKKCLENDVKKSNDNFAKKRTNIIRKTNGTILNGQKNMTKMMKQLYMLTMILITINFTSQLKIQIMKKITKLFPIMILNN